MTLIGALTLLIAIGGLVTRRTRWVAVALGVGAGLPYSAGTTIGQTVPVFSVVAFVAVLAIGIEHRPVRSAGYSLLVAFGAWSTAITLLAPWAFAGIPTLSPRKGVDLQIGAPSPLTFSISNVAQVAYLVLALLAVLFLVRSGTARTALMTAAWTGVGVSAVRSGLKTVGFDGLGPVFDTLDVAYSFARDTRWRGVFSEPSELATFSLASLVLALITTFSAPKGRARTASSWLAVLAAVDLIGSASGTAVVATAVVGGTALLALLVRYVLAGGRGTPWIVLGALTAVAVILTIGDELLAPAVAVFEDKVGSPSQTARSGADARGVHVLVDTFGFGAGLGSNRSSSFAVTLASTTGVVGVLLFGAAVALLSVQALRTRGGRPVALSLLALLVAKSVSTPDLSTPLLWVLLAACIEVSSAVPAVDTRRPASAPGPLRTGAASAPLGVAPEWGSAAPR